MENATTTFVTCFIELVKDGDAKTLKTSENRFRHFETLAATGVPLCVFVCEAYKERILALMETYPNIRYMGPAEIEGSWFLEFLRDGDFVCASSANREKDTPAYFALMNNKLDYLRRAIQDNPFQTKTFAWVDFSLFHIIAADKVEETQKQIQTLGTAPWALQTVLLPGCWQKPSNPSVLTQSIHWRFCGGFLLGSADAILEMVELAEENLPVFLRTYKTIVWEVNFWAYLELCCGWKPTWYRADHNHTILSIPARYRYEKELRDSVTFQTYILAFAGSERETRMRSRVQQLGLSATFVNAICQKEPWMPNGLERIASLMVGDRNMMRLFLESGAEFGVFCEDDVHIHKDFTNRIRDVCATMILQDLDIVLLGYLLTHPPTDGGGYSPRDPVGTWGMLWNYPDHQWGTQSFVLSRSYALYCHEKFSFVYAQRTLRYGVEGTGFTCYNPDWLLTKRGRRALVYPMICVEEGNVATDDGGQIALHHGTHRAHFSADSYV